MRRSMCPYCGQEVRTDKQFGIVRCECGEVCGIGDLVWMEVNDV